MFHCLIHVSVVGKLP